MPPQIISADFNVNGGKAEAGLQADAKTCAYKRIYAQMFLCTAGQKDSGKKIIGSTKISCIFILINIRDRTN